MKIIGVSGFARSGKDLFTNVAQNILNERGIKSEKYALAYELKSDLKDLIKEKIGIDVFTENTEEKTIIRPLLVAYGDAMRKISQGKYWTNKVETRIASSKADVIFITDIRYDHYPEDECTWLQRKMNGKLIHLTKYKQSPVPSGRRFSKNKIVKIYDSAPNEHEMLNNPKIMKKSDLKIEWQDYSESNDLDDIKNHPMIYSTVLTALQHINVI